MTLQCIYFLDNHEFSFSCLELAKTHDLRFIPIILFIMFELVLVILRPRRMTFGSEPTTCALSPFHRDCSTTELKVGVVRLKLCSRRDLVLMSYQNGNPRPAVYPDNFIYHFELVLGFEPRTCGLRKPMQLRKTLAIQFFLHNLALNLALWIYFSPKK